MSLLDGELLGTAEVGSCEKIGSGVRLVTSVKLQARLDRSHATEAQLPSGMVDETLTCLRSTEIVRFGEEHRGLCIEMQECDGTEMACQQFEITSVPG